MTDTDKTNNKPFISTKDGKHKCSNPDFSTCLENLFSVTDNFLREPTIFGYKIDNFPYDYSVFLELDAAVKAAL